MKSIELHDRYCAIGAWVAYAAGEAAMLCGGKIGVEGITARLPRFPAKGFEERLFPKDFDIDAMSEPFLFCGLMIRFPYKSLKTPLLFATRVPKEKATNKMLVALPAARQSPRRAPCMPSARSPLFTADQPLQQIAFKIYLGGYIRVRRPFILRDLDIGAAFQKHCRAVPGGLG